MRIIFLCSSLEPGRDGVGDYVRRLAGEMIKQGDQVLCVALNDQYITDKMEGTQGAEGINLYLSRFPASWADRDRYNQLSFCIKKFNPQWISLQFVNFGLHHRGLPLKLMHHLRSAIGNIKFHIMFHELWCGMGTHVRHKEKLLGDVQKIFIRLMVSALKPAAVFTTTRSYLDQLDNIGIKARLVPVFGNIPLGNYCTDEEWSHLLVVSRLTCLNKAPERWLVLGFFGAIYPCSGLQQLFTYAGDAARKLGRKLGILIIGHGKGQNVRLMSQAIAGSICWQTGILPSEMINRTMKLVDLGVVTTTSVNLTKSGTAAAWLERGVPVLISASDSSYNESEMQCQGAYQVTDTADVLTAFKSKGKLLSTKRFENAVEAYSSLI